MKEILIVKTQTEHYWLLCDDFDYGVDWDNTDLDLEVIYLDHAKPIGHAHGVYFPNDDVYLLQGKEGQSGAVILHHHDHGKTIYRVDRWNPEAQYPEEHELTVLKEKGQ